MLQQILLRLIETGLFRLAVAVCAPRIGNTQRRIHDAPPVLPLCLSNGNAQGIVLAGGHGEIAVCPIIKGHVHQLCLHGIVIALLPHRIRCNLFQLLQMLRDNLLHCLQGLPRMGQKFAGIRQHLVPHL